MEEIQICTETVLECWYKATAWRKEGCNGQVFPANVYAGPDWIEKIERDFQTEAETETNEILETMGGIFESKNTDQGCLPQVYDAQ